MSPEVLSVELARAPARIAVLPGGLSAWIDQKVVSARQQGERLASERAVKALDRAADALDKAREAATQTLSSQAVHLAVEIARTLVRAEIDAGRLNLEVIVREALHASGVGRGACEVHLNPLDAAQLANVKFRAGTLIQSDETVRRGDVQVSTPHGLLVREIPEALRSIHERLLAEIR